jgi:hypothetical protein
MKTRISLAVSGLFILGVLLMPGAVWAQPVRGVTDTEVLVGQTGPQTGPAALWGAVARGTGLYFKGINDEGGIHGRKIKYFLRDDSYQPAKTKAIGKEFVEQIGIFSTVGCVGVACGMTVRDYYTENKVIMVSMGCSGVTNWIKPFNKYIFPISFPQPLIAPTSSRDRDGPFKGRESIHKLWRIESPERGYLCGKQRRNLFHHRTQWGGEDDGFQLHQRHL